MFCAGLVFAILCSSDQGYPVTAINQDLSPSPRAIAQLRIPPSPVKFQNVSAVSEPLARTHEELLALERSGDRNYVEFSVARSDSFQAVGPVSIRLWSTNARKSTAQLSVVMGQRRIDFKRINRDEPLFISTGSRPVELVINLVSRNQIAGYISESKPNGRAN